MSMSKTRTISIASGKGGAGKTSVAACLAWILAEQGHCVCLVDMDLGLSNIDILLGLTPKFTLEDVILKDVPVEDAVTAIRPGLDVISGGSGVADLADLDQNRRSMFLNAIGSLDAYDYLLLDNSPGIHRQVVAFCLAAKEQILVVNPEPASVTDAYALLKVLAQNGLSRAPYLLLNRVPKVFDHRTLMHRFTAVCEKHLKLSILALGAVPDDPFFRQAASKSALPPALQPESPGCIALIRAAGLLTKRPQRPFLYTRAEQFWDDSLARMLQGLSIPGPSRPGISADPNAQNAPLPRLERVLAELSALETTCSSIVHFEPNAQSALAERLAQAGARLTSLGAHLRAQTVPKSGPTVGVLCPDPALRSLLVELIQERSGQPVVINGAAEAKNKLDLLLCSVGKLTDSTFHQLQALRETPCIWLTEYARTLPEWTSGLNIIQVLEKPFSLQRLYASLSKSSMP